MHLNRKKQKTKKNRIQKKEIYFNCNKKSYYVNKYIKFKKNDNFNIVFIGLIKNINLNVVELKK